MMSTAVQLLRQLVNQGLSTMGNDGTETNGNTGGPFGRSARPERNEHYSNALERPWC